jgi:hypothetical protein
MGVILSAIVVAIVVTVGAGYVLRSEQEPSWEFYSSTTGARVGDPGCNLVGGNWGGNPEVAPCPAGEENAT